MFRGWSKVEEPGETPFPSFVEMPTIPEGAFVAMVDLSDVPATQEEAPTMEVDEGDNNIATNYAQI